MWNPNDADDPFRLKQSIWSNLFGTAPGDGEVIGGPHKYDPTGAQGGPGAQLGGNIGDPITRAVSALVPSNRTVSSKLVGYKPGSADLSGASDLINNYAFQRLWEGYNPGKVTDDSNFDWISQLLGSNDNPAFTRHQGKGEGYLWGYVDPSWLAGFNPGKRVTTITDVLAPLLGGGAPGAQLGGNIGVGGQLGGDVPTLPWIPPPPIVDPFEPPPLI